MNAIDFVVRTPAGGIQRDVLQADANQTTVVTGSGAEVSFNLSQSDMRGYSRVGEDLHISLADGRVIVLDGYFANHAEEPRLFVSADGELHEVFFAEGNDGVLFAEYGKSAEWGKWSPDDALIHYGRPDIMVADVAVTGDEDVSMLAAGILGGGSLLGLAGAGAAVAGAAIFGGAGGGDDTTGGGGGDDTTGGGGGDDTTGGGGGDDTTGGGGGDDTTGGGGGDDTTGGGGGDDTTGGGGGDPWAQPTVDDTSVVIGGDDAVEVITVTGTGDPGDSVEVQIGGETVTTTVSNDGVWEAVFENDTFPDDGTYTAVVNVTDGTNTATLTGPGVTIDTTPPMIDIVDGTAEAGDLINLEAHQNGATITGTGEAGASVTVTIDGTSHDTVVDADGNWSVDFTSAEIATGEYTTDVVVVSSDSYGNTSTLTETLQVDTVPNTISIDADSVAGDGTINATEAAGVVTISGTATQGATVSVTVVGVVTDVVADADGNWSFDMPADSFAGGEYDTQITATSVDAAGNASNTSATIHVDTVGDVAITGGLTGPGDVINANELAQGVVLTGTSQPGSTVVVQAGDVSHTAVVDANGNWSATFAAGEIAGGTHEVSVTATATDPAGNVSSANGGLNIDTEGFVTVNDSTVETDGVVNAAERSDGVQLTGTAEPGSAVTVTLGGVSMNTVADGAGNWVANYGAADIPGGETTLPVNVVAVDPAGNTSTTTGSVEVDTIVDPLTLDNVPGGADQIVNAAEAGQGLSLSGRVEPGSQLVLELNGVSQTAVVDANGNWTASFAAADLPSGEVVADLVMTATDTAGNTRTETQSVTFDTVAGTLTLSPDPIEGDDVINAVEASDGVVISGTSDPGAVVTVTLGGATRTALTDGAGNWSTTFAPGQIAPGTYDADITAEITDAAGNTLQVSDTVHVDTRVDDFAINDVAVGVDDVINAAEAAQGVTVTGTTEPGASVVVTIEGETRNATVNADGTWSAFFEDGAIASGEYDTTVEVQSTDAAGNVATTSEAVRVDTFVNALDVTSSSAGADDVVSARELADGNALTLTGQVEPGSAVSVRFNGTDYAASVSANGSWTVDIPAADVPGGEYDAVFEVTATDAAGNPDTVTETIRIDTLAPDGPVVESFTRDDSGLRGISTALTDHAQDVLQVAEDGTISDVAMTVVDVPAIGETNYFFSQNVPDGSDLVVSTADDAGNTRSTYLVLDDETPGTQVSLGNANLGAHNVEAVDLEFAEEANLTLTEADILALSSETNTLTVHGGADDVVTIVGATRTGTVTNAEGDSFVEYSLGDATVLIDDDVTNVVI